MYGILSNPSWPSFTGKFVMLVCKEGEISNTFFLREFKDKGRRLHETEWRTCSSALRRFWFLFNNQPDALIIQIYSVKILYMFRASSVPIIRSFLLYIRHW